MKLIIIGRGNVATNLLEAYQRQRVPVEMVSSREGLDALPTDADAYIYAVRDNALQDVINKVHVPARALHVHTSGTMPITVFGADKPHCGIFYPFQTFSKEHIIEDFTTIPIFFEAKAIDDVTAIYSLALAITPHIYETTQADRERLHVAGVMANNFTNCLYGIAKDILADTHIPFSALLPLMDETVQKIHTLSPKDAQTGPARRGDETVMQHHLELLKREDYREVYQLMSRIIQTQQS